jgi:hypothetical protein
MAYMISIVKPFKSSMGPIFSNSGPYLDQKGGPPTKYKVLVIII